MNPSDIEYEHDRYLFEWFEETKCALVLSSYKSGSTITLSRMKCESECYIGTYLNTFNRVTGMFYSDKKLWLGTCNQILELVDIGELTQGSESFDNCYYPRFSHFTSDLDIHDLTVDSSGDIFFVASQYNCIFKLSRYTSDNSCTNGDILKVYWKPPWISDIVCEDRCHLNGLALRDGKPRYVTAVSTSDIVNGWRDNRYNGGIVYDLVEDKVVCSGLSMPHSPRWHNDRLWVLDSGTGYFGYVYIDDDGKGKFISKTFIPGFIRGLTFYRDKYAVICSSTDRHENLFSGLKLGETLGKNNVAAKCGVFIINLKTFSIVHNYIYNKGPTELYDVVLIPDVDRTRLIDTYDPLLSTVSKHKEIFSKN